MSRLLVFVGRALFVLLTNLLVAGIVGGPLAAYLILTSGGYLADSGSALSYDFYSVSSAKQLALLSIGIAALFGWLCGWALGTVNTLINQQVRIRRLLCKVCPPVSIMAVLLYGEWSDPQGYFFARLLTAIANGLAAGLIAITKLAVSERQHARAWADRNAAMNEYLHARTGLRKAGNDGTSGN